MSDALVNAMLRVATIADDDFTFTPTITPVVDMTNVTAASGRAGQMFGSISSGLRGSLRVTSDNAQTAAVAASYASGSNNIVSEIQSLSGKLESLGTAVGNMQIVLDTGVLVGATTNKIDRSLGTLQMRKGRGN